MNESEDAPEDEVKTPKEATPWGTVRTYGQFRDVALSIDLSFDLWFDLSQKRATTVYLK